MKGDILPEKDHITRFCRGTKVCEDGSIDGSAFRLKEKSGIVEEYLSVNWLEFFRKGTIEEAIQEIRVVLKEKLKIKADDKLALLNIGELCSYVIEKSEDGRQLQVFHKPELNDESHAGIHNIKLEDDVIADLIAQVVKEKYSAKNIGS